MVKIWPIIINWLLFKRRPCKETQVPFYDFVKGKYLHKCTSPIEKTTLFSYNDHHTKKFDHTNILHSSWTLLSYIKKHDSLLLQSRANSLDQKSADYVHNTTLLPSFERPTLVHKTFYIIIYMILTFDFW